MTFHGTIHNGVVVLPAGMSLPDGTEVTVLVIPATSSSASESGTPSVWQKLADLGRQVESEPNDLPADLASNHDYYLHGLPKRQ